MLVQAVARMGYLGGGGRGLELGLHAIHPLADRRQVRSDGLYGRQRRSQGLHRLVR